MSDNIKPNANGTVNEEIQREKVRVVPLKYVDDFPNHPYKVVDDASMDALVDSIRNEGVINPIIVIKTPDERYQVISGHRRKHACEKLGIELIKVIVREISRDEAIIAMVDSNLQRENILPSEKASAYKMKMDAMKRQGTRTDLTCRPLVDKLKSADIMGDESGESGRQIQRYIRLTELTPELLQLVDENRIGFRPAVELSYLTEDEQRDLYETIDSEDATPSLAQAIRMKELSRDGKLDMDTIFSIMTEQKGNQHEKIKIPMAKIKQYFPENEVPSRVEAKIIAALEFYQQYHRNPPAKKRDDWGER